MDDETDELTPLSEYAARAIERANNGKPKDNIMCVIDEACSACVQINYEITDFMPGMYRPQLPVQLSQRSRTCTCRHRQGMDRP